MSARTYLADALEGVLAGYRVVPAPVDLDALAAPTILVYREEARPGPVQGTRTSGLAVWVLTPHQDPRAAEDPLDDALTAVLDVLDDIPAAAWSSADRGVYAEKYNGYKVAVTLTETKE